jgi:hypothetical protein
MSIQSRARHLQHVSGWHYQHCLIELRAAGSKPADLARRFNWPLTRADAYHFDPNFDEEYRAISKELDWHLRYVKQEFCEECGRAFFQGLGKKGDLSIGHAQFCPTCIDEAGGTWECSEGHDVLGQQKGDVICDTCFQSKIDDPNT